MKHDIHGADVLERKKLDLKLSVAMCTFNGVRFVGAQLASIATQDRPPDELVICDDGSSDGTVEIVQEFTQRARFPTRLVVNGRTLGSTKNFERAISLCQGAIVALADQDDVWYRHKLARIEQAFLRSTEMVAAFSDADIIDDNSRPLGRRLWPSFSFHRSQQIEFAVGRGLDVLLRHPVVTGASMAFHRRYVDLLVPIPPKQIHDMWISTLLATRGEFAVISDPLMQYRQHQKQQLGPGPRTLWERTKRAKLNKASFYLDQIERLCELRDRLEDYGAACPNTHRALEEIGRKISHLEHRARLPRIRVTRIPGVLRQTFNGYYWRYSSGWSSIAKDLLFS